MPLMSAATRRLVENRLLIDARTARGQRPETAALDETYCGVTEA
jgi:hypothetical protein